MKRSALKVEAADIVSSTSSPNIPFVFIISAKHPPVTILSQQMRAFNLVWALDVHDKIAGKSIAIIGGGFAGISAAAAALSRGAIVTLYEKRQDVLQLQRGNHTRFLHPHILDWPLPSSRNHRTQLPLLNWEANAAYKVADSVAQQWKILSEHYNSQTYNHAVSCLLPTDGGVKVKTKSAHSSRNYDLAIIATGFGLESRLSGVRSYSYWEDDPLHQGVTTSEEGDRANILISGCGDGGLIDTLRARLCDFQLDKLVETMEVHDLTRKYRDKLLLIEAEVRRSYNDRKASTELQKRYMDLIDENDAKDVINRFGLRTDSRVTLNGTLDTPFTLKASILNRFCLALLLKARDDNIDYITGKIDKTSLVLSGTKVHVKTSESESKESFDYVMLRHGPQFDSTSLLLGSEAPATVENVDRAAATMAHWPVNFIGAFRSKKYNIFRFEQRTSVVTALCDASRLRLTGHPNSVENLKRIAERYDEHRPVAEFELGLWYFSVGDYERSIDFLIKSITHLPKIFSWSVAWNLVFIQLINGSKISDILLPEIFERENKLAHRFSSYTSFTRGWAHLILPAYDIDGRISRDFNNTYATVSWKLVNQKISPSDIIFGYPFVEQVISIDAVILDGILNPRLNTADKTKWFEGYLRSYIDQTGFWGHSRLMSRYCELLANSEEALAGFACLGQAWKFPPKTDETEKRLRWLSKLLID